jgi:hypothetical protein
MFGIYDEATFRMVPTLTRIWAKKDLDRRGMLWYIITILTDLVNKETINARIAEMSICSPSHL